MHKSPVARALRLGLALCVALAAAGRPAVPPAAAAPAGPSTVFVVDREDDTIVTTCAGPDNDCTLRGAMTRANQTTGAIVQLEWNKTYTLTDDSQGHLTAYTDMTIQPGGVCGSLICFAAIMGEPGWTWGLFTVGLTATVLISDVILTESGSSNGGAIYNEGALTLYNSLVLSNTATGWGGGIMNEGGDLVLQNTYVTRNRAQATGGAIANQGGTVALYNSTIMSNTVYGTSNGQGSGGALTNENSVDQLITGTFTISNSFILTNTAPITVGYGGGLFNDGLVTIYNSTFSGNTARYGGGFANNGLTARMTVTAGLFLNNLAGEGGAAIRNDEPLLITGSTFHGNTSLSGNGAIANSGRLIIIDSTFTNNSGTDGGAIGTGATAAQVWLDNTDVLSNTAIYGGGLAGWGAYTLTNGSRINNNTGYQGGGVNVYSTGRLEVQAGSQINNNSVSGGALGSARGGGIENNGLALLTGAEVLGNLNPNGQGGGLHNSVTGRAILTDTLVGQNSGGYGGGGLANDGSLTVTASAIYSNTTLWAGGGITNSGALRLLNTTLSGNQAGFGGGIWSGGVVSQSFTTIAANSALSGTGGLQNIGVYTTGSSLLAGNLGPSADCTGPVASLGHNLVGVSTACTLTGGANDQLDLDALLLPLSFTGGTWVVDLQVDSPALDAADQAACPADDQAHTARPLGLGCDVGAYESANFTFLQLFLPLVLRSP